MSPAHPLEAARVALLRELAVLDTAAEPEFDAVTRMVQQALGAPITLLSLLDVDRQWFKSRQGLGVDETPRAGSFCAYAVAAENTLLVPDARQDERFRGNALVVGAPHIVFYAGALLRVEGLPLGTVCAIDTQPRADGGAVVELLETAADLLSRLLSARLDTVRARRGEALALESAQLNSDWAWQIDENGHLCWLDDRYAAASGEDPRHVLGRPLISVAGGLLSSDDAVHALRMSLQRGSSFRQLPLGWQMPKGAVTLLLSGVPLHSADGHLVGFRGTAIDPRRGQRAAQRAERAEQLLSAASEHFDGAVMLTNDEGRIVLANSCWRSLYAEHLALSCEWPEVLRRAVDAGEFPQAVGSEEAFVAARLDRTVSARAPLELLRGGRWWLTQEHRLPDGSLLQIGLDVTNTKTAEARWRYHAELHQAVAEVSNDGIVVVNQYGDVISFNPAAARLWRESDAAMSTLNVFNVVVSRVDDLGRPLAPQDHPVRLALRKQAAIHGFRYGKERPAAPIQWFDLDVIPLGNACEVAMVFRDVSEQRAARAAGDRSSSTAQHRGPFLLGRSSEGSWQWDSRQRRLFCSLASQQLLGYAGGELDADEDILRTLTHPDDLHRVRDTLRSQLAGAESLIDFECRMRHQDGSQRWVAVRGRINRNLDGEAIEASGLMQDITTQRAALSALAEKKSAESANAAKSAFLSRVSHEIRTPLNAIVGFSRLLQRGELPDRLSEPVACIHEAGRHLLGLVNDLLDVQRIETDSLPLSMEAVDIAGVMGSVGELLAVDAAARDIRLEVDAASLHAVWAQADLQRLRQVLMNMVGNAIKYGAEGRPVRMRGRVLGDRLRLEVVDEGPGLSVEQQARLFQPFERLGHERSGIAGTGLGLVISRRLAEAMGGRLDVSSAPGCGCTFWLELARAEPPRARMPAAAEAEPEEGATLHGAFDSAARQPLSLLYVEDNPVNAILLESLVATLPQWHMRVAASGAEARALVAQWTPDLLILDAHLPDAHGLALLPELRALRPALADVPAVMFTADAMPQDYQDSHDAGFYRHWTKPIDVDTVLRELRAIARELNSVVA